MSLSALNAIFPIDGLYRSKVSELAPYFSEEALIKYRVLVEIEYFIALCEIPLPQLQSVEPTVFDSLRAIYKDFSSFPQAYRDLSLIVDRDIKYEDLKKIIIAEKYVIECVIIDTYEGDKIPDNKRSLSIRINYQSYESTLSSKNLDKIEKNILSKLKKQLGAFIRE